MAQIVTALYLLFMLVAGWRLFGIGWSRLARLATAAGLILPIPLLVLIPALLHPERPFAGLLQSVGIALLICGILCMAGGWSAARLRAGRRK
ncbi:MAG TPA: hypothetical protein DCG90_07495 [Sphingobium sp.]|jgi:zinc transporter ZupT|uniref:hypothetical protein n=1 Tax=unclassified Sphingobium TaxID=2611147 RepID=UPI0007F44057|nr:MULTISPECIES: hypothetical protein [unclassified Sphingobium]OAN55550.1 hypothetical protein A7Q26_21525 [Sphingobium sp. TCM1]WIW88742.1 hypothetical protein K3M67_01790 [Sphingobium sp. V4]HAF41594.1 hypothetical protein [Sphingobium sp.]